MSGKRFLSHEEMDALQTWHAGLNDHRGERARLRRAQRAEDVLLTQAFFSFQRQMPLSWQEKKPVFSSAAVAGLLSHVKTNRLVESRGYQPKDNNKPRRMASFAEQLATPAKEGKKPAMSELRFQQLQKSRTTDDFYRGIIRAVKLLEGSTNIVSLASDIIHWHLEFNTHLDLKPANRLAVCWATDYFTVLAKETKTT